MIFFGMLLMFGLWAFAVLINPMVEHPVMLFIDWNAAIFVTVGVVGFIVYSGPLTFLRGLKGLIMLPEWIADAVDLGLVFPKSGRPEIAGYYLRLYRFTAAWGLLGMVIGAIIGLANMDPDFVGIGVAFCLFSFLYSTAISLFFLWPIAMRFSARDLPPENETWKWRHFPLKGCLVGLGAYFAVRAMMTMIIFAMMTPGAEEAGLLGRSSMSFVYLAFFAINPADICLESYPFMPFAYVDFPSIIFVVSGIGVMRLMVGRLRNRLDWVPPSILIGIFGTVIGLVIMLGDINPETFASGTLVAILSAFYGFFIAILFVIGSKRLPILLILSAIISVMSLALLYGGLPWVTYEFIKKYIVFTLFMLFYGFLIALFVYIAYTGIKKRRERPTTPPQSQEPPQPLRPEEEKAQQLLDDAISRNKG